MDLLCFSCLVLVMPVCVCLFVPCGHLLEKGLTSWLSLWCITVSLSLSYWYSGSGVVLDCFALFIIFLSIHMCFYIAMFIWYYLHIECREGSNLRM